MKRLIKKIGNLLNNYDVEYVYLSLIDGMDKKKSTVIFENDGVRYNVTGEFFYEAELVDQNDNNVQNESINLETLSTNDIVSFIESTTKVNIENKINDIMNGTHNPEWQLPTKEKINAWFKPSALKLKNINIKESKVNDGNIIFIISLESESDITSYESLAVQEEEFEIYNINPNDFKFTKDIMTGEFYR